VSEQSPWLTDAELRARTGYIWHSKQCAALAAIGIAFEVCPRTGRPLVERAAVLKYRDRSERKAPQPNWDAIQTA
jgi:hypothetical protein